MPILISNLQYTLDIYLMCDFRDKCQLKKMTVIIAIGSFSLG